MALFNRSKKEAKIEKTEKQVSVFVSTKKSSGHGVLLCPRVTEKAVASSEHGAYVFVVSRDANKIKIKRAVEGQYGVHVAEVRVVRLPRKERVHGRFVGWKAGIKKAVVQLKKGEKIEIQ